MASNQFFMHLGQLTPDDDGAIAEFVEKILERRPDTVWSFEKHDRSASRSEIVEPCFPVFRPSWWEA